MNRDAIKNTTMTRVPFRGPISQWFSPSGEQPEQYELAHTLLGWFRCLLPFLRLTKQAGTQVHPTDSCREMFHKYCCYTKTGGIITNLTLWNPVWPYFLQDWKRGGGVFYIFTRNVEKWMAKFYIFTNNYEKWGSTVAKFSNFSQKNSIISKTEQNKQTNRGAKFYRRLNKYN